MKRISLDDEPRDVQEFIRQLPQDPEGVEIEFGGQPICMIVPVGRFSADQRENLIAERWNLIRRAQQRNTGTPLKVLDREIQDAVEEVRQRKSK